MPGDDPGCGDCRRLWHQRRRRQAAADAEATKLTADAEAERIAKTGSAEAEKILAIGRSTAEAYELQVRAMGEENFTRFKITEEIGRGQIRVIPDIIINGAGSGSDGSLNGLMGLQLLEQIEERKTGKATKIVDIVNATEKSDKN